MAGTHKMKAVGSKAEVYHGTCRHTVGGLTRKDLVKNRHGRIVSRRKQQQGKKAIKHLFKLGYKPKKGTFRLFKKEKSVRRSTRRRGGSNPAALTDAANQAMKLLSGK